MKKFLVGLVALVNTACYSMVPLTIESPPARGITLVVNLNTRGADSLARLIGPGIMELRGDVVDANDRGMQLAMRQVTDLRGIDTYWSRELVSVDRTFVDRLRERRLSKPKSILTGVAIIAGLFMLTDAMTGFAGIFGGGSGGNTGVD